MPSTTTEETIDISIRTRSKVLFSGKVHSITSYNVLGEFDVLPQHANFVTLIRDLIILNRELEDSEEIKIESGVMNVDQDRVDVYLGF